MECNKEEAVRAKDIAEQKMQSRDFFGAQKFVLKAQQLFPDLENVSQMLTVCEVHCSAERKVNESEDWYGILQVEPTADDLSIKKQYRKLALLLHPDKNKFSGAEAAFKLIGEAHMVLSDQTKRSIYDMKRKTTIRTVMPNRNYAKKESAVPNSFTNHSTTRYTNLHQQHQTQAAHTGAQTFWTLCPFCAIRYQYYKSIMDKAIRCQNCLKPFIAYDLNAQGSTLGANSAYPPNQPGVPQHMNFQFSNSVHSAGRQSNYGNGTSNTGFQENVGGRPAEDRGQSRNKAKESSEMDKEPGKENDVKFEKVKLEKVNKRAQAPESSGNPSRKKGRKIVVESSDSDETDDTDSEEVIVEEFNYPAEQEGASLGRYPRRSTRQKQNVTYKEDKSDDDGDDPENLPTFKRLRKGGSSSGADRSDKAASKNDANEVKMQDDVSTVFQEKVEDKMKARTHPDNYLPNRNEVEKHEKNLKEGRGVDIVEENLGDGASLKADCSAARTKTEFFSCPDPEFYDFEKDRDASRFAAHQIWAMYDELDGMPRYYAWIKGVFAPEFKLHFTWLEHDPVVQTEADWSDAELPVACGHFKLGSSQYTQDIHMLSHLMPWRKGLKRNSYEIYPQKGEVWALYKGWDIKWSSDPDKHRQYDYEVVEVLSDFAADMGTDVVYLVKVKGFVSLFCKEQSKGIGPLHISSGEILRFSHLIPSHRLTGEEREGIPAGFHELDPASLPINFEKTFPSVSLDEIKLKAKDRVDEINLCFKSSTDMEMNENGCDSRSFKSVHLSSLVSDRFHEKKHNQPSVSQHAPKEAAMNVDGETVSGKCQVDEEGKHLGNRDATNDHDMQNSSGSLPASPVENSNDIVLEYPVSEFHNFESGRSSGKFQAGQIWALYCEVDGFPKYYAFIRKIESDDFRVHVTWLDACAQLEEEVRWSDKDLPFGCGRFKLHSGKDGKETFDSLDTFSHLARAEQTQKKYHYDIYPDVGQVWAVYKNWRAEWELADIKYCQENFEYDVVEVLDSSCSVMKVIVLEKVDGFKSVFMPRRNKGNYITMEIARNEFLRFSHRIPSFRLTEEKSGKLRGYWELDPASVPEALLCTG